MKIKIQSSQDSFRDLRESGSYYIDKTEIIREYLEEHFEKAVMFARPRRFGKSLTMTMFRDFLDIRQESKDIFEDLKIMNYPDLVKEYMNQFPVVFLSLKEVFGNSFEAVFANFKIAISDLCKQYGILLESKHVHEEDKALLRLLREQAADEANTTASLNILSRMLYDHFQRPVFVIIDEYDVPMAKAYGTPAYDKVRDMIEHMLSYVCKTNSNVKGVILSGCLYTVKNSTYTGVNNIVPYTVLSPLYASDIGFTDENVRELLEDAGLADLYDTVEEWYDGYIFGRERMYCPWDVMSFVKSKLDGSYSEAMGPKSYWLNTSETSLNLIHGFLGKTTAANERFEQLLAGNTIECSVNEFVPYHRIHESGENLWSALVETGYLTKTVTEEMPLMPLRIPNKGIQVVFRQEVWNYFNDKVNNVFVRDLVNALWAGEIQKAEAALNQILEATLSFYHEYHEYSYHLILDGFFTGLGYRVQSERETGFGRSDLIILDPARRRCLLLELKHVQKEAEMEMALQEAESQIIQKKYESELVYEGYTTRIQYGMAFCDKRSLIARVY
ncbi:MAG: AAA family ATPase [Butyrivibrio sp.]|nr:AAA family ATPase [Butyrivibrio sp.]MBR1642157.1 AAA family ATPase [Butyrivibrio sp.]